MDGLKAREDDWQLFLRLFPSVGDFTACKGDRGQRERERERATIPDDEFRLLTARNALMNREQRAGTGAEAGDHAYVWAIPLEKQILILALECKGQSSHCTPTNMYSKTPKILLH